MRSPQLSDARQHKPRNKKEARPLQIQKRINPRSDGSFFETLGNRSKSFPFHHHPGHPKRPRVGRHLPKRPAGRSGPRRSSMCSPAFLALQPAQAEIEGTRPVKIPTVTGFGFSVVHLDQEYCTRRWRRFRR